VDLRHDRFSRAEDILGRAKMATILILAHELDGFHARHYLVEGLFALWQAAGHQVVLHEGLARLPPADVVVNHVDLTVVPREYVQVLRRYPSVVNGRCVDISKRAVSGHLVRQGDPWRGPVIVKTNLNCGGLGESLHAQRLAARGEDPGPAVVVMQGRYPIFASSTGIPGPMWSDRNLVMEKFLPEQDERGFYVRTWVFFGDRERCNRVLGRDPVVKAADVIERVPVPVPDEIRAARARLGVDYGKIDFVLHEGKPVLYDVNRTPTVPPNLSEALAAGMAELAPGIDAFVQRGASTSVGQRSPSS